MVGDTRWDLEMAKNAGVDGVAVLCGAQGEEELRACAPLACLPEVGALLGWLDGAPEITEEGQGASMPPG
jgi:phosphoglycolate phosphatase